MNVARKLMLTAAAATAITLTGATVAQASPPGPAPDWSTTSPLCQATQAPLYEAIMRTPYPFNVPLQLLRNAICML